MLKNHERKIIYIHKEANTPTAAWFPSDSFYYFYIHTWCPNIFLHLPIKATQEKKMEESNRKIPADDLPM